MLPRPFPIRRSETKLLRANGNIERRHSKLWFTGEAVLNRVLQTDVFFQSEMTR